MTKRVATLTLWFLFAVLDGVQLAAAKKVGRETAEGRVS